MTAHPARVIAGLLAAETAAFGACIAHTWLRHGRHKPTTGNGGTA